MSWRQGFVSALNCFSLQIHCFMTTPPTPQNSLFFIRHRLWEPLPPVSPIDLVPLKNLSGLKKWFCPTVKNCDVTLDASKVRTGYLYDITLWLISEDFVTVASSFILMAKEAIPLRPHLVRHAIWLISTSRLLTRFKPIKPMFPQGSNLAMEKQSRANWDSFN